MLRFDSWLKRFRNQVRTPQRVLAGDRYETLTATQACRYRELQQTHVAKGGTRKSARVKPHYSLKEAASRLKTEADEILLSAEAGRVRCYVLPAGLRGQWWHTGADGARQLATKPVEMPKYLALSPADCKAIQAFRSANVSELEHFPETANLAGEARPQSLFLLREPLWVDAARIVLKHPLPQ